MIVDRQYCMSSYLMFRTIVDHNFSFKDGITPSFFEENADRHPVRTPKELQDILEYEVKKACSEKKVAIALSGGIDSAILAKFMPKNSVAYTFKCIVPGIKVTDESVAAAQYAKECGLQHKIIEISWQDMVNYTPILMKHKGAPIHSIEGQIYKASLQAKKDGFDALIFGESADVNYGGMDSLLSKDWNVPDFIERYSYVMPHRILKQPKIITDPFIKYSKNGLMHTHDFIRNIFYVEAMGSYTNATNTAGIELVAPFSKTFMGVPLDLRRIRNGEGKYFVREVFKNLYPNYDIPKKVPMPRPMDEWMKDWKGPNRNEFWQNSIINFSGDQKWMVWALEIFLDLIEQ